MRLDNTQKTRHEAHHLCSPLRYLSAWHAFHYMASWQIIYLRQLCELQDVGSGKTELNYDGDDAGALGSHLKPIDNLPPVI